MTLLSIIVPCYFNEANIPLTFQALLHNETLFPEEVSFEYVFVDDGSRDQTFAELLKVKAKFPEKVKVIKLVRNVGSYNAILAGMEAASGDCNAVISADLQDPPALMASMYAYWERGFKLVIGARQDRNDPKLHMWLANFFHYILRKIAFKNLPPGGFDYVFFDQSIRQQVVKMRENNGNALYLMAWMGYEFVTIPYSRQLRAVGKSRWTLRKKIKLFIDTVTSFSYLPIRIISVTGILLGMTAFLYGLFVIASKFFGYVPVEGWSALMVVILFVSSFQMVALGVIGEYVWRAFDSSRNRPLYIVEKIV